MALQATSRGETCAIVSLPRVELGSRASETQRQIRCQGVSAPGWIRTTVSRRNSVYSRESGLTVRRVAVTPSEIGSADGIRTRSLQLERLAAFATLPTAPYPVGELNPRSQAENLAVFR